MNLKQRVETTLVAEGHSLQGDGEVTCYACGDELDPDSAAELRNGLCFEHLDWGDGGNPV